MAARRQVSAISVREIAARQSASRGRGTMGPALGQRLLGEGPPDRVGEVAAEMSQSNHRVLRAVQAARQRRHQGDGGNDADDRPGAEAEAPLPRRVDRAGGGVPDQQEARQHQHAGVEGEQHVADGRRPVRPQPAEEGEHVPGGAVGVGEEAAVDRLPERRLGRRDRGQGETGESHDEQQQCEAARAGRTDYAPLIYQRRPPPSHRPQQHGSRPHGIREGTAELGGEQEAERTHGLSWRRPRGWRGRGGGASPRRRARARRRRWRRAARRCGSAASRASARPPA